VYKFVGDLYFYATASAEENEIILAQVLATFVDTISLLLTCVAPTQRAVCPACASRVSVRRWQSTHLGLVSCLYVRRNDSSVEKRSALENLDLVFMTLDELVDGGCVKGLFVSAPFSTTYSQGASLCRAPCAASSWK